MQGGNMQWNKINFKLVNALKLLRFDKIHYETKKRHLT